LQCGVGEGKMRIFQNHPGYEAVGWLMILSVPLWELNFCIKLFLILYRNYTVR
jgi:hypothetical protein